MPIQTGFPVADIIPPLVKMLVAILLLELTTPSLAQVPDYLYQPLPDRVKIFTLVVDQEEPLLQIPAVRISSLVIKPEVIPLPEIAMSLTARSSSGI